MSIFASIAEQTLNGIILGSMYALVACGLTLIWGALRMLNFAQGDFYMLAGYFAFFFMVHLGFNPILSIGLVLILIFLCGVLTQRLVIHQLLGKPQWEFSTIVATMGLGIIFQNAALNFFGSEVLNVPYLDQNIVHFGIFSIASQRLIILAAAAIAIGALWYLLQRTNFGLRLRAASQDRDAAMLYGVDFNKIYTVTFGISTLLAGVAAIMLAPIFSVNPWMGAPLLLKGFIVVVLGGLGNFPGAIVAGLLLGLAESLSIMVFPSEWREVVSFSILIITIMFRPWGLFGNRLMGH